MDRKVQRAGEKITRFAKDAAKQAKVRDLVVKKLKMGDKLTAKYGGEEVNITDVRERIAQARKKKAKELDRAANRRDREEEMVRNRQTRGNRGGHDPSDTRRSVNSSYSPEGETLSEVDSSTSFADRVMNRVYEGFAEMSERQRKDYDKKANKPMHGREASEEERKEMAAEFQNSRGGASTKTKKKRDLRLRKAK